MSSSKRPIITRHHAQRRIARLGDEAWKNLLAAHPEIVIRLGNRELVRRRPLERVLGLLDGVGERGNDMEDNAGDHPELVHRIVGSRGRVGDSLLVDPGETEPDGS